MINNNNALKRTIDVWLRVLQGERKSELPVHVHLKASGPDSRPRSCRIDFLSMPMAVQCRMVGPLGRSGRGPAVEHLSRFGSVRQSRQSTAPHGHGGPGRIECLAMDPESGACRSEASAAHAWPRCDSGHGCTGRLGRAHRPPGPFRFPARSLPEVDGDALTPGADFLCRHRNTNGARATERNPDPQHPAQRGGRRSSRTVGVSRSSSARTR